MKRKLLFSSTCFLSVIVVSTAIALLQPQGFSLLLSLSLLIVLSAMGVIVTFRSAGRSVSRLESAFERLARENSDLESKVQKRREALEVTETRLHRIDSFLDSIIENIPDMIFVKDAKELRFVRFNKAGEELLGYKREDLIGKNDYDFFPKAEADFFTAKDRQVLARGKTVVIDEEPIHTKTGVRILHTKKIPLLDANGEAIYLLGISEDITARKSSEANLTQRTRELAQAQSEKDQMELFAYVAAHDLREPAHKISSFGDLLADHLPDTGPAREYLARMRSAAERMGRLIDDLLKFSKISRGQVATETVQLEGVIRDILQDFDFKIQQTGAKVEIGALPQIEGGRVQVQELFRNLIGNALKFHRPLGIPEVNIFAVPQTDGGVSVTVKDNGIGFEQTYADRIFRPFERLHSRRDYEGTGIGLAICKTVAEQMGARISATAEPGSGAAFTVTFPSGRARFHDERAVPQTGLAS